MREFLTLKRVVLITLGILIAVLSWVDYLLIYYFENPLGAAIHFYFRDFYTSHAIQEFFQGMSPIFLLLIASISGGIIDGIIITGLSSLMFMFGKQTQLRVLILSLSYQPRLGWEYGIVVTLLIAGIIGSFFSQFQIYSIILRDLKFSLKNPKVILPFIAFSSIPLIVGKYANIYYLSPTRMVFFNWSITTNEILVVAFIYSLLSSPLPSFFSKRFWSGAVVGGTTSLSSFIGLLGRGTETLLHDLIWLPYYVTVEGGIKNSYLAATTMASLFIFVSFLWGGFWASAGRISTYTSPPVEITEPHMKAYVFRDLWSNFFLHGKNKVKEFEEKSEKKITAKLKSILGLKSYVTYEKMDRVPRGEIPPMPEPELEIIPLEDNKCKIRVIGTNDVLGPFINPDYLEQKYEPIWNPLALMYQATIVKGFIPLLVMVISVAAVLSLLNISPWIPIWISPLRPFVMTGQTWLLIGSSFFLFIVLIAFAAYWAKKSLPALSTRPECAPAIFVIGLLAAALFVFLEYFTIRLAEFLNIGIVSSPYLLLLGLSPAQWISNWLSFFEYNTTLVLFEYNRVFSACLYGSAFLVVAALLIGISGVQVIGLERYNLYFYATNGFLFPYKNRHDAPVWLEGNYYWVMRYIYLWPGEFTLSSKALYAIDYERVELWVNAETGELEWVVSDYHWRELFYRVPPDGKEHHIIVDFNPNFHTPEITPIHPEDLIKYKSPKALGEILMDSAKKIARRTKELFASIRFRLFPEEEKKKIKKAFKARVDFTEKFLIDIGPGLRRLCAHVAASLPWSFWRYPLGVHSVKEESEKYFYREKGYFPPVVKSSLHPIRERIDGEGYPAVDSEQICPKCSTTIRIKYDSKNPGDWICPSCKIDTRRYSFFH
ncbi:MAG: hypothetical protein QXN15_04705 [Candidatus Jordarchaeales archaeon]